MAGSASESVTLCVEKWRLRQLHISTTTAAALGAPGLEEHGASLEAADKEAIEAALKELDEAIKGSDKASIEAKTEVLGKASQKLGEKVMAAEQAKAGGGAAPGAAPSAAPGAAPDADVVDADFKEVNDKK